MPRPDPASSSLVHRMLPALLLLLTVFGPISMDLYLPALPALTSELGAATSVAQLTVTACLVGLAAGQLIAGPLSDRLGRRRILLVGIIAYVITSAVCAVSPSMELLILARFAQGLAGGVGIVVATAAGRDILSGARAHPLLRSAHGRGRLRSDRRSAPRRVAQHGHRLAGTVRVPRRHRGTSSSLSRSSGFPETLPVERRTTGGFGRTLRDYRTLLADRVFLGAVLNQGFLYAALFAYLAGSTFVLQDVYGLSPQWYAAAFGLNSAGHMVSGYLAGRAAERWSVLGTLAVGVSVTAVGALGLLVAGLTPMPLWVVIAALFLLSSGVALSAAPATTLALAEYPQMAGTASSLLGMVRFGFGGVAAPLVGVAGALSILPLGVVAVAAVALAAAAALLVTRRPDAAVAPAVESPEPASAA